MTVIVGLVDGNTVVMGGDSAGVSGKDITVRRDSKVFTVGEFVIGFTSSFRMGQLLRFSFVPPVHPEDVDVEQFMCTSFVNAVRDCLKTGGYAWKTSDEESGGEFLVGYRGRLFKICSDYQVGESLDGYDACGCGESYALGVLAATVMWSADRRVTAALEIAAKFSSGVRGPFNVITQ